MDKTEFGNVQTVIFFNEQGGCNVMPADDCTEHAPTIPSNFDRSVISALGDRALDSRGADHVFNVMDQPIGLSVTNVVAMRTHRWVA